MELDALIRKYKKDRSSVEKLFEIGEIIFTEGTYEVEVINKKDKTPTWPFIQLDDKAQVLDAFCTCEESETKGSCFHLLVAYFRLVEKDEPIHVRFKKSFFNALFKVVSYHTGYDKKVLKKEKEGSFYCLSKTKKKLFSIQTKSQEAKNRLNEFINSKVLENEETSLKFANISAEELSLWKQGKASHQLQYDLSFFSDLAKWFFLLYDENNSYEIKYSEEKDDLPTKIEVVFKIIQASCYISFSSWREIIPCLNTIKSKLSLYEYGGKIIQEITYDREKQCFNIITKDSFEMKESKIEGLDIGKWIYVKDVGFYPKEPNRLFKSQVIEKENISSFLNSYSFDFQKYLTKEKVHLNAKKAKYYLFFDEDENLHINAYLFQHDDFFLKDSYFFGSWVYIQDRGFFLLEDLFMNGIKKVIPRSEISDFVTKHRVWLHNIEGFQTHFGTLESYLIYNLTEKEDLVFSAKIDFPEDLGFFIDFEDWVYIKSRGFYSKKEKRGSLPIRPGLIVKKSEIAKFIASHKDELDQVLNFFTKKQPIEKIGIDIELNDENLIVVKPKIQLNEGYHHSDLYFFDRFVYLKNVGFFEIQINLKFPEKYEKEKTISLSQESYFITYELDRLKSFIINIDKKLRKPTKLVLRINNVIKKRRKNKRYWFADLIYESDIGKVHAVDVFLALQEQKKYFFSDAGLIFLNHPRFNWLKNLNKQAKSPNNLTLRLTTLEWIRLCIFENLKAPRKKGKESDQTKKLLDEIKKFETNQIVDLSLLKAELRPYQETGLNWLWFLYCHNLSGLLCDDMGLGKTHQAMALIAAVEKENSFKYIVVCPTSVIYHWQELLKTFLPHLKVYIYHGLHRNIEKFEKGYDLLLTSYGVLRSERALLKNIKFEIAIFDEIQIAKNQKSLTHKSLNSIDATMRLGLTGTPIENYLRELKAIFDLVLPSYLPSDTVFRDLFINPIEKMQDIERKRLLKKLIKPFILRRKKSEVLLDLPEKIEEISYCDLSDEQQELYNEILKSKEVVIKNLKNKSKPVSFIHIFSILSKLKQICDHPSLILKDIKNSSKHTSGKFNLFIELLNEARDSNQKLVVFSQYLGMLEIIENYLNKKSIGFASIKGTTKKRYEQINKFKEDPKCEVFVASLLAAGVGIDLSAASVVIHYDRWWNPAKENQATDRVHRLGQNRGVQVFKFVTKNTIEENIHRIIERKQSLIDETIGVDDADQVKSLSREELINILHQIQKPNR